jgi:cytochrome b6-f complex subunit 5
MRQWGESSNALLHLDNVRSLNVVEPILSGIVLGLIPVTLAGLFVAAYLQYRRGNELGL